MSYWYDKHGNVIVHMDVNDPDKKWIEQMKEANELLSDKSYKIVAQDFTPNKKFWVSTVWLGLDHDFSWREINKPNPHPVIFETMVFTTKSDESVDYAGEDQERYRTEAEALAGHNKLLAEYTKKESEDEQSHTTTA